MKFRDRPRHHPQEGLPLREKLSPSFRYTLMGAAFGFLFPIFSTLLDLVLQGLPVTPASAARVQAGNPLHWVIDTAPFFLGLFAGLAGRRQAELQSLNLQLQEEAAERDRAMSELVTLKGELETRVRDRTEELHRRASQLRAAAEVGQAVAAVHDLDELLPRITHLIHDHFGFYHIGIFLLDESGEHAELRAANSEGGRRMLAAGHSLRVGEQGLVGYVTGARKARQSQDVGQDAAHYKNPYLPQTRSELALPLIAGQRLLGALDIQSSEPSAFREDDVEVLQVMADQVAVAIENARLWSEREAALRSVRQALQKASQEALQELLATPMEVGLQVDRQDQIRRVGPVWNPELDQARQTGTILQIDSHTLAVPVRIREHPMGAIRLRKPLEGQPWSRDEISLIESLTDQLGVALENARLHSDALMRAQRERLVTEITTRIRATNDPQEILQTAVQELRQALRAGHAQVQFLPTAAGLSSLEVSSSAGEDQSQVDERGLV